MTDPIYTRMASGELFRFEDLLLLCELKRGVMTPEAHMRDWDARGWIMRDPDDRWRLTEAGKVGAFSLLGPNGALTH